MIQAVLFDLDGTLADTAPDLGGALNRLRVQFGAPPLPIEVIRSQVSAGVAALVQLGLLSGDCPEVATIDSATLTAMLLDEYARSPCASTKLCAGIPELLNVLDAHKIPWGVVTNKIRRFSIPIAHGLALTHRVQCWISGDDVQKPKPDPASLLLAGKTLAIAMPHILYIGDDPRDISAGRAAHAATAAAFWGYGQPVPPLENWGADVIFLSPAEVIPWVFQKKII